MKIYHVKFLLLACLSLFLTVVYAPAGAQTTGDWRFGVVESYTAPNSARELGTAWTRIRYQWADAQRGGPDSWTPQVSDEKIERELAAGRLVAGLLIGIPEWARDENGLPQGLWLPYDDPGNSWGTFVRQVAERYAGRIDHWIIWNEPDIEAPAVAHTWDGSVDDFAQLQRVAYLAAKDANPDAIIHLAAFTYWADVNAGREQYMARLLDSFLADPEAAQHGYYFDVATAHLYFQPDQVYDLLLLFQGIMRERGIDKPIWLVETNAPPHDDPSWPVPERTLSVMQDEQAAFMPQALASALAAGAERIAVYKMQDIVGDRRANPEPFGLLRLDGSRRPAFRALHVAVQYMGGSSEVTRERWDEIGQFRLMQQDRMTTVLFARLADPQQAEVPAIADRALLVDLRGTKAWIEAEDGRYVIDLPPALCIQSIGDFCMIGGSTYYLIQSLDGGDPPEGVPPIMPQPTITPTSLPSSTATTAATAIPSQPSTVTRTPVPSSQTPTAAPATVTPLPTAVATQISQLPDPNPGEDNQNRVDSESSEQDAYVPFLLGVLGLAVVVLGAWWLLGRRGS
jgi:hypothetical protein